MSLPATSSQTVGPFFSIGLRPVSTIAAAGAAGERIVVEGRLLDGDGAGVADGLLEIWQANSAGKYAHPEDAQQKPIDPAFRGFGRVATDRDGGFRFTTIVPGPVPGRGGRSQAPHLVVSVFARGLLVRLATRMYFPDDPAHATDPVLERVPAPRRGTLIARRRRDVLEWNVILQGEDETVFFDV